LNSSILDSAKQKSDNNATFIFKVMGSLAVVVKKLADKRYKPGDAKAVAT